MKLRLSPTLSYLIGLWKYARTREGIGLVGNEEMRTAFLSKVVAAELVPADQIQVGESAVFFYHSAYRAFFDEILAEQEDRYKHANDFAAAFLAGLYDAVGGQEEGKVFLTKWDRKDEIVLLRLNYKTEKAGGRLWVGPADVFLKFTKNWRQVGRPTKAVASDRGDWLMRKSARAAHRREQGRLESSAAGAGAPAGKVEAAKTMPSGPVELGASAGKTGNGASAQKTDAHENHALSGKPEKERTGRGPADPHKSGPKDTEEKG